jgi:hypothetical protein
MYFRDPSEQFPYLATDEVDNVDASADSPPWLYQDTADTTSTGPDWDLSTCCDKYESIFISLVPVYLVVIAVLWNTVFLKPMKLIAVFVHELSHAIACWMTGGTVKEINVNTDEGGVTKFVGGCRIIIIPAGYLGGAFWGGVLVAMSGNRWAAFSISIAFCVAMLASLILKPNCAMIVTNLFFVALTVAFIVADRVLDMFLVNYLTLYYGVFIGAFSIYDIYDDLLTRTVEGSDAHACFKLIPCCLPRCVGLQFAVVALAFQAAGVYFGLLWMTSN